jgi:hypothetical protein
MKKKIQIQKPLALHRDVLRNLVPDQLHQVAGGVTTDPATVVLCPSHGCPPPTRTTTCPM